MTNTAFWSTPERWDPLAAYGEEDELTSWCEVSRPFVEWCRVLLTVTLEKPSLQTVAQAHFDLHRRYRTFRNSAPTAHRDLTRGHLCLYQAYIEAGDALDELERKLAPPGLLVIMATAVQQSLEQAALDRTDPVEDIIFGRVTK